MLEIQKNVVIAQQVGFHNAKLCQELRRITPNYAGTPPHNAKLLNKTFSCHFFIISQHFSVIPIILQ
jgi:hypothetical protein